MTWDELVEVAVKACWQSAMQDDTLPWDGLPEMCKAMEREAVNAALRALLAKGYVIVPGEATEAMIVHMALAAAAASPESNRQWWADLIESALSAGSIKPEGE